MDERKKEMEKHLTASLQPSVLKITNRSSAHAGHAGDDGTGQTHYLLKISSDLFKGKSRIELKELLTRLTSWLSGDELLLEIRGQDVKFMRASSMHPPEATEPDPTGR